MLKEDIENIEKLNKIDGLDDINRGLSEEENLKIKSELQKTDINRECIMEGEVPLCEEEKKQSKVKDKNLYLASFKSKVRIILFIVIFVLLIFFSRYI